MILAVASGKGGTGKTTLAAALAEVAAEDPDREVRALDCDVEAPDLALQLRPTWEESRPALATVPVPPPGGCPACRVCAEACAFGALAVAGGVVRVFEALCHGCGACLAACPRRVLRERVRETGRLSAGRAGRIRVAEGRLAVGESMATPVIRQLLDRELEGLRRRDLAVLDGPPGTACSAVATLARADRAVLVTEPTPFGHHDLMRIVRVARDALRLPVEVVLNRDDGRDERLARWCAAEGVPVALRIPDDARIARAASRGEGLLAAVPSLRAGVRVLLERLEGKVAA